jgi:hypothetical protein
MELPAGPRVATEVVAASSGSAGCRAGCGGALDVDQRDACFDLDLVANAALVVVLRVNREGDPIREEDRVVRLGERGIVRVDPVGGARFDGQRLPRIDTARTGSARIRVGGPGLLRHPEEAVLVARLDPEEIAP